VVAGHQYSADINHSSVEYSIVHFTSFFPGYLVVLNKYKDILEGFFGGFDVLDLESCFVG